LKINLHGFKYYSCEKIIKWIKKPKFNIRQSIMSTVYKKIYEVNPIRTLL